MPRFNEQMNNLRNQEANKPDPKLSKSEREIADINRQIRVDNKVNSRINKLLKN